MTKRILGLVVASALWGCGETEAPLPTINSFTASKTSVGLGDRVQLTWKVADATAVDLRAEPGGSLVSGSTQLENTVPSGPITAATHFTLTARNADGKSATASVHVEVDGSLLRISRFAAAPTEVEPGAPSTLSWVVAGSPIGKVRVTDAAGNAVYDGVEASGSREVTPAATTVYTLEVSNIVQSISATTAISVRANPPMIVRFEAMPNPAATGTRGTVSWQTERADEVQIKRDGQVVRPWNSNGAAAGFTAFVFSERSSVFTLEARNGFGQVSQDLMVNTLNPPTALLTVSRDRFTTATATVGIHWETANADTITLTVNGRAPAGFTGQASGDLVVTATRTLDLQLVARSPIDTLTRDALVRRVSVFTQDVVIGDAAAPAVGAAVRVEDASGARFYEGVTDAAGRATIDIEAEMYPVSVSVAVPDHFAAAVVGLDAPMRDAIRIDPFPAGAPPAQTADLQGTFFNKAAIDNRVVVTGYDVEGFEGTGISYMMQYAVTNEPLTLVALEFDGSDRLINGVVTSTVRTGGAMSVPIDFPRPARAPADTVVSLRLPSTGAFMGQRYSLAGQAVVQQRAGKADILVGDSAIGALSGGALPWTVRTFDVAGMEPSLAGVLVNGTSLRVLALQRSFGAPVTVSVGAVARFAAAPNMGSIDDLRIDFEGTGYDAVVLGVGSDEVPFIYRVVLVGGRAHTGARVPRLPSAVGYRGLNAGLIANANVIAGAWSTGGVAVWTLDFAGRSFGYPAAVVYSVERPGGQFMLP